MTQRFAGKRIVITGAGRGLGFAFAERLGREGASLVLAEIDRNSGAEAESKLRAAGVDARFVATDISSETSVQAMAAAAAENCDGIHGLVANAGWANNVGGKAYDEIAARGLGSHDGDQCARHLAHCARHRAADARWRSYRNRFFRYDLLGGTSTSCIMSPANRHWSE